MKASGYPFSGAFFLVTRSFNHLVDLVRKRAMPPEQNKQIIQQMFVAQLTNDMETYARILADDLQWKIMQSGLDRPRTKAEMIDMLQGVHRSLSGRWTKEVVNMVAEGDYVACEAVAMMELANGNVYNQKYHYLYRLRDGQVVETREYLDTLTAYRAFDGKQEMSKEN